MPISEFAFGALTQNRSSLEPSLGICRHCPARRIVDHARYRTSPPEEPMRDPKRLWRIRPDVNVVPVPPPVRKINSKGTACGIIAVNPRDGSRLLRFLVKAPYTDPEIGTTRLARARARQTQAQAVGRAATPQRTSTPDTSGWFGYRVIMARGSSWSASPIVRSHSPRSSHRDWWVRTCRAGCS